MYIRKVDGNQREIVEGLRALGYSVRHTHIVGKGFPDLVVGKFGFTLLVEVKRAGEKLTPDEKDFFETWTGAAIIGTSVEHIHEQFTKILELKSRK